MDCVLKLWINYSYSFQIEKKVKNLIKSPFWVQRSYLCCFATNFQFWLNGITTLINPFLPPASLTENHFICLEEYNDAKTCTISLFEYTDIILTWVIVKNEVENNSKIW